MEDEMVEEEVIMVGDTHHTAKSVVNLGIKLKMPRKI